MHLPVIFTTFALIFLCSSTPTYLLGNSFGLLDVNSTYDYIVVGGGTAGLTVAARLVQHSFSVAIVEAGGFYQLDNGNASQVPGYSSTYMSFGSLNPNHLEVDWDLISQPQQGLDGRQIHYTTPKTLGGGSAVHAVYHRPSKGSLKQWAQSVGDSSFEWDSFNPYLKKSWHFTPPTHHAPDVPTTFDPAAYQPRGGPMQLSFPNYLEPFDSHFARAFSNTGFKLLEGFNSGALNGFGPATFTIDPKDQTRSTSESGFLRQALQKPNLQLYIKTLVNKILFDNSNKASGVNVTTNGGTYTLFAKKEVILSAGVFHSPQVLMLSGIGPAATLNSLGIPVLSDLKGVGANLWDHAFLFTSHKMNITTNSGTLKDPQLSAMASRQFLDNQDGPLTGVGGEIIGFEKFPNRTAFSKAALSDLAKFPADFPECEYLGLAFNSGPSTDPNANDYVYIAASLQTTTSRGYVNISSADPTDPPTFNPNILGSTTDQEQAVQAVKRARSLASASGVLVEESAPGANITTDEQILEWAQSNAVVGDHASGTCGMGKSGDPQAVVDSKARVFGVHGLRVVDASSFPILPPGHPYSTVYALAEKIADTIIKES